MKASSSRLIAASGNMARESTTLELSRSPAMPHTREDIPITPMEDIIMEDITMEDITMEGMGTIATTTTTPSQAMEATATSTVLL